MNGKQFRTNQVDKGYRLYKLQEGLHIDFPVDDNTVALDEGAAVEITATGTIQYLDTGFFLGHVTSKFDPDQILAAQEDRAVVKVVGSEVVRAIAEGTALATGALVRYTGQSGVAQGLGDYVAATTGTYAHGIVLEGAGADEEIKVLLLNAPVLIP